MSRKYQDEYEEAADALEGDTLPHKILTAVPKLLHNALYKIFRRNEIDDIGISEEEDGVWIYKRRNK